MMTNFEICIGAQRRVQWRPTLKFAKVPRELGWIGLGWVALGWLGLGLGWIELEWIGFD